MKKISTKISRKPFHLFWILAILIFFNFCNLNLAFAESGSITDVLRKEALALDGMKHSGSMTACRGISSANTRQKIVALTFDDGPHRKYTDEVLAILRMNNIKATFFVVGKNVEESPDVVKLTYAEGHVIGNHSYSHPYLSSLSGDEIETELTKTNGIINRVIGVSPFLFRPPYGSCSPKTARIARNLDFKTIMWSADYRMDLITASEKIANEIVSHVRSGAIILLHDGGGNRENVVEALPIIIRALRNDGYEFVTVPELLNIKPYFVKRATDAY